MPIRSAVLLFVGATLSRSEDTEETVWWKHLEDSSPVKAAAAEKDLPWWKDHLEQGAPTRKATATAEPQAQEEFCHDMGCGKFLRGRSCQCNIECIHFVDCCSDFGASCLAINNWPLPKPVEMNTGCFYKDVTYEDAEPKAGLGPHDTPDAVACQQLCSKTTDCSFFSFWTPGKVCHMAGWNATVKLDKGDYISGPVQCHLQVGGPTSLFVERTQYAYYTTYYIVSGQLIYVHHYTQSFGQGGGVTKVVHHMIGQQHQQTMPMSTQIVHVYDQVRTENSDGDHSSNRLSSMHTYDDRSRDDRLSSGFSSDHRSSDDRLSLGHSSSYSSHSSSSYSSSASAGDGSSDDSRSSRTSIETMDARMEEAPPCAATGVVYVPDMGEGQVGVWKRNANACQERCQSVENCEYWSFSRANLCRVSPYYAVPVLGLNSDISGTRTCEAVPSSLYAKIPGVSFLTGSTERSTGVVLLAAACVMMIGARAVVGISRNPEGEVLDEHPTVNRIQQTIASSAGWIRRQASRATAQVRTDSRYVALAPKVYSEYEEA